jgi:hypothetical protein
MKLIRSNVRLGAVKIFDTLIGESYEEVLYANIGANRAETSAITVNSIELSPTRNFTGQFALEDISSLIL